MFINKTSNEVYMMQGMRSTIGIEGGIHANRSAEELGAHVLSHYVKALEESSNFRAADIDLIIAGNAVGGGGNIARLMALSAGLPSEIPAYTIDLQCGSSLECIATAAAKIASGQAQVIMVGGMDSSSTAPKRSYHENHPNRDSYFKQYGTTDYKVAKFSPEDHSELAMLEGAERTALFHKIDRETLNPYVIRSHSLAKKAREEKILEDIIIPFDKEKDEGIRERMSEKLCNYLPCILPDGKVLTAANACLTNDGAAFLLLTSREYAQSHRLSPVAEFLDVAEVGAPPARSPETASLAIMKLLTQNKLSPADISIFECNEAFAVIDELFFRQFGEEAFSKYNIFGGALAYGHPYGASGAIITLHGLRGLQVTKGSLGVFSVAAAGGIGTAILVRRLPSNYDDVLREKPQDKQALVCDGNSYTYSDLLTGAEKYRNENLGIVHMPSSPSSLTASWNYPALQPKELYYIQENSIEKQLVAFLACQGTKYIPLIVPTDISLDEVKAIQPEIPSNAIMAVCTSGTTGKPKILFRSFGSWYHFFPWQNQIFETNATTRMFAQGSLAFTGNLNLYMGVFSAGGCIISETSFHPKKWETIFEKENVNLIYLIPSKLLLLPRLINSPNTQIKMILAGSQSLGQEDAARLKSIFPSTKIILYYGASELNYITYVADAEMTEKRNLIGKPFPGVSVSIEDDQLYIDTPYHIEGINVPYTLTDCGYEDTEGNFYYLGRKDDIICIRGRKIPAPKIENAIEKIDSILEVCVSSVKYNNDEQLAAYVVTDSTITSSEELSNSKIYKLLENDLAPFEIPKIWIKRASLPKTESGKILRRKLQEE